MARIPRAGGPRSSRGLARDRHGRGVRAAVTGPYLPLLSSRANVFDQTVASAAQYLRDVWPAELEAVSFEVAAVPASIGGEYPSAGGSAADETGVDRWRVFAVERRIVLYRLPIERLSKLHKYDELHRRMMIESCVFRAVAELIGKDPWDLAPDRYRNP
ncbi:MAG: metallopeptidase family protein [Microbacteriaceae bacterium]